MYPKITPYVTLSEHKSQILHATYSDNKLLKHTTVFLTEYVPRLQVGNKAQWCPEKRPIHKFGLATCSVQTHFLSKNFSTSQAAYSSSWASDSETAGNASNCISSTRYSRPLRWFPRSMHLKAWKEGLKHPTSIIHNRVAMGHGHAIPGSLFCSDPDNSWIWSVSQRRKWFNSGVAPNPTCAHLPMRSKIHPYLGPSPANAGQAKKHKASQESSRSVGYKTKTCISKSRTQTRRADGPSNPWWLK